MMGYPSKSRFCEMKQGPSDQPHVFPPNPFPSFAFVFGGFKVHLSSSLLGAARRQEGTCSHADSRLFSWAWPQYVAILEFFTDSPRPPLEISPPSVRLSPPWGGGGLQGYFKANFGTLH